MRAALRYGALAALGSLTLSTAVAAPAHGADAAGTARPPYERFDPFAGGRAVTAHELAAGPAARGVALAARRAAAAGIAFGPCPKEEMLPDPVTCGTVQVPLDYAHPEGREIALTVSHVKARGKPSERQGALVYNPGGPGASSMSFPMVADLPEWKKIAAAYDIVGYAPRGVGHSAPLSCESPQDFAKAPTAAPEHPSRAYKRQRVKEAKAYARACAAKAGDALPHYTSINNARDLDVLRAALGEKKLTFMGASYGTYFGAVYATLFPSHVRRMVFDSAVDPDPSQVWYGDNMEQSAAFERRWADFRTWVARHDAVYHLGTTAAGVERSYEEVRARVARRPAGGTVGTAQLQAAMLSAGYYDDYWAMRATALSEYLKGDEKPLVEQASPLTLPEAEREAENANAVYTAVECNDAPWPGDWRDWDRDNTALARTAPFETWDNVWQNLPCAYWPAPHRRPVDVRTAPGALPPTLILAAERDAATPYEGALELQRRLAGSSLVTERDAGTHGIAGGPNACVNAYMTDYLLTGRTPGTAASCAPHKAPNPVSLARAKAPRRETSGSRALSTRALRTSVLPGPA
ncbi:alpha/beta hydrolase [Streptomyces montanisoli]|uniref:Alpha/beta fold hydrolase n=1 Tax=Streptomyces montanisoli TaxID=2798581 RepID=A0A940RU26_9ACTN|nr:alpha/beta hydrolase [Streptomyces montanisoli]MBP0456730.1 alpha/beta fold hydrolase [Streptomyces montanisoli]